jgi:hypothetical protein
MAINPHYPIYLGVSQDFFTRMQELNILDGDAKLTTSMAQAEQDAKEFVSKSNARAKKGFAGIGRVLASLFSNPPTPPVVTSTKVCGVVVKFDTAKLQNHYQLFEFGDRVEVGAEVIQSIMLYVEGFYQVVDIEELVEGDLYA